MIMGERAVPWLDERGLPSRLVRVDGSTMIVAGWPEEGTDRVTGPVRSMGRASAAG
jgi:hypothetical protein